MNKDETILLLDAAVLALQNVLKLQQKQTQLLGA